MDEVERFHRALGRHEGEMRRVAPDTFPRVLEECIERPAVGSSLPFDDYSLRDTAVELRPTTRQIHEARTGVSAARLGICSTGSVVIRSPLGGDDPVSLFPESHVVLLMRRDLVDDLEAALRWIGERMRGGPGDVVITTGPSATADMGELVYGAHGPRRLTILMGDPA